MEILAGKHAGKTGRVHQLANDWMSVNLDDGGHAIVKPTQVRLNETERAEVAARTANVGMFWQEWRLNDDGTFSALRERPRRRRRA